MTITLSNELTTTKEPTMELASLPVTKEAVEVARLKPADLIVLETNASRYEFTVLDPVRREGLLTGGKLAARIVSVKWSGTVIKNTFDDFVDHKILSCGGRAIFHVVNGRYPNNFLVTSTIVRMVLQRDPH